MARLVWRHLAKAATEPEIAGWLASLGNIYSRPADAKRSAAKEYTSCNNIKKHVAMNTDICD
jgi:hypothetical protein